MDPQSVTKNRSYTQHKAAHRPLDGFRGLPSNLSLQEIRATLESLRPTLISNIKLKNKMFGKFLIQKKAIKRENLNSIMEDNANERDQVRALLDHFERASAPKFILFLRALEKSKQPHLATQIVQEYNSKFHRRGNSDRRRPERRKSSDKSYQNQRPDHPRIPASRTGSQTTVSSWESTASSSGNSRSTRRTKVRVIVMEVTEQLEDDK